MDSAGMTVEGGSPLRAPWGFMDKARWRKSLLLQISDWGIVEHNTADFPSAGAITGLRSGLSVRELFKSRS